VIHKLSKQNATFSQLSSLFKRGVGGLLSVLFVVATLQGQDNTLSRVSTAERSDGKGYVIRFHLSQSVDSFKVTQPDVDLIQMTLYGESLDTTGVDYTNSSPAYDEIGFYNLPFGIGVDVYMTEGTYYLADAYKDKGSDDMLLALTETDREDVNFLTDGIEPVIWSRFTVSEESLLVGDADAPDAALGDSSYRFVKDKMKFDVVVIDPGHGGHDPGTIGYRGTKEKDVVMDIAKKLGDYINEYLPDVKVVFTREQDEFVGLEERGQIANRAEGDLFVSIHCNGLRDRSARGTEVYFLGLHRSEEAFEVMKKENSVLRFEEDSSRTQELTEEDLLIYELANSGYIATSEKLAGMMEYQFDDRAQRHSRGVKQAGFIVLFHASMPAILVETGFLTNPGEQRYLTSSYGQSIIASAIFRAIRNYKLEYEKSQNFNTTN